MKLKFLILLQLFSVYQLSAQLVITSGAQFIVSGNQQLTLQNTDLVNNGSFATGDGIISFTGSFSSKISGSQPVQFNELEMDKANNSAVLLQRAISVKQRITFTSGFLNLNGFNADLGNTGKLDGEQESTRIVGPNGGEVLFNVSLNAPTNANPGNLGLFITSKQNLGNVIIRRGHQSQATSSDAGKTVLRYYDILSTNNSNLNATLRFKYFDGERTNPGENLIVFFKSQNANSFSALGFTSRDIVAHFVEKTGVNVLGRFTLSNGNVSVSDAKTSLATDVFRVWPNPARDMVFINIVTAIISQADIKVFDNKGALVQLQKASLIQGTNKVGLDIKSLANGAYNLIVSWNNGKEVKTMEIIKQ